MDVWRITIAVLRRWYIFLPLLLLTGGLVYVVGKGVQPEYEVSGTALITPGRTEPMVPNPYGNQDQASAAVAIVLNSPETQATVATEGLAPDYEVMNEQRSTIMNLTVRAEGPELAVATGDRILEIAADELASRQTSAGVASSSQYRLDVLAQPSPTAVTYDGKLQSQAVVGVLGASAALLVAVLFDDIVGLYRRRRARRAARRAGADVDEDSERPSSGDSSDEDHLSGGPDAEPDDDPADDEPGGESEPPASTDARTEQAEPGRGRDRASA